MNVESRCLDCGSKELKPGEDYCYSCLNEEKPGLRWGKDINERVADFSRIGTEEWKEEMRANWKDIISRLF